MCNAAFGLELSSNHQVCSLTHFYQPDHHQQWMVLTNDQPGGTRCNSSGCCLSCGDDGVEVRFDYVPMLCSPELRRNFKLVWA